MIGKRIKKLFKLGALIGVRQGYFWGRNLYQILREPYLTLKELKDSKDKSQIFLIIATALSPLFLYIFLRIIYDLWRYKSLVLITGPVFTAMIVIEVIIFSYLFFWTVRVLAEK